MVTPCPDGDPVSGGIVLAGGDEFRAGCEVMDAAVLRSTGQDQPCVLIVPAAARRGAAKAASNGVAYFSGLGAAASGLMVLDREDADDPGLVSRAAEASVVYFTGGSPDHLLATLEGSRLLEQLRESMAAGAVVGGSSAGAMVMGSMMRGPSSGCWVPGLGLARGVAVLPHHEASDPERVASDLASHAPAGLKVLGIDARSGCFGSPGRWTVLGPGRVVLYEGGSWRPFFHGDVLPGRV